MSFNRYSVSSSAFLFLLLFGLPLTVSAQLQIVTTPTALQLVNELVGQGATVSNVSLNCAAGAFGTFTNGNATNLGIASGIVLTTGDANLVNGPNNNGAAGFDNGNNFVNPNLTALEPLATNDVCILQFDLVPQCSVLQFNYVFGSEEYPEFVNAGFNDAFGFFLTGPNPLGGNYNNFNIARVPGVGSPVTIDNVNPGANAQYYVNNTGGATIQYDGFTVILPVAIPVTPCQTYTLQLAIADAGDGIYDSGVFLATNSLNCNISNLVLATTPADCNGQGGTATATVTGGIQPYFYSWSTGATTQTVTGLAVGTYTVSVTDNLACTLPLVGTVVIGQPTPSTATATNTGPYCPNDLIQLNAGLGVGTGTPTAFAWADPAGQVFANIANPTVPNAQPALAGFYTVTVTFNNGCTATAQTEVSILGTQANLTGIPVICSGQSTTLSATGGGTYAWSTGESDASILVVNPGTYAVTVTAPGGCTATAAQLVTVNNNPVVTITGLAGVCVGQTTTLTASGAANYIWSTGENTAGIVPLNTGTYQVTGIDAAGCSGTATTNFAFFPAPQPAATNNSPFCAGNILTLSETNAPGAASYAWSGPNGFNAATATPGIPNAQASDSGVYTVTVTDANGCTGTASTTVTINALPDAIIAAPGLLSCATPTLGLDATGSIGAVNFIWNGPGILAGNNTATPSVNQPGVYALTVTTAANCTDTASVVVGQNITPPTITLDNITQILCNGICSGSIGLSTVVSVGPATYAWSGGLPATEDQTNLCPGVYSVIATDAGNGCTTERVGLQVTEPPLLTLSFLAATPETCFGACNATLELQAGGGTQPFVFVWSGGLPGTEDQANLCVGNYAVTLTDANGCSATLSNLATTGPPALSLSLAAQANATCAGTCDGALDILASGGIAPYAFVWSGGLPSNEDQTNLCAGTYSVTLTDANGCSTNDGPFVITEPLPLGLTFVETDLTCFNQCNGSIDLTVTGGVVPYSFAWCSGATTEDLTGLCVGNECVTVTDANGCTANVPAIVVNQPSQLGATATATNATCNGACNGTANLTAGGGTAPYTFLWSNGSTDEDPTGLCAGTYSATITDANGCTATAQATVSEPTAIVLAETHTDVSCAGFCDATIDATENGGTPPYAFLWSNGATTEDLASLCAGTYTLTVSDAASCTATISATVTEPTALSVGLVAFTNVTCNGQCNGTIDQLAAGGTLPYSFAWSNGAVTEDLANVCAGTYQATVTDANGCSVVLAPVTITEPTPVAVTPGAITNVTCNGFCDGALNVTAFGGTLPYAFNWSFPFGNTPSPSNVCAGVYSVTLTDGNGCTASASNLAVTEPPVLAVQNITSTNLNCFAQCDGTASVTVTGGTPTYAYSWNNGSPAPILAALCAGLYSVTITDANNCTVTAQTAINEPPVLSASAIVVAVSCFGGNDGSVDLTVVGGTPNYTFAWNNLALTEDIATLTQGVYDVTITDANGCTFSTGATVPEPTGLVLTATTVDVLCTGICSGSADLTVSGGTAPYTYLWSNGATDEDPSGLCVGTYDATVTDANGCTATISVTISEPNALVANVTGINDASCNYACDGNASALASGGTPYPFGYLYVWNDGQTAPSALNLCPGSYTVTVTDANNCTVSTTATVGAPTPVVASVTTTPLSCYGGSDGTATGTATGGTPGYQYQWSTGNVGPFQVNLLRGNLGLTVTDANGCTATAFSFVGSPNPLNANPSFQDALCSGLFNGVIALNPSGGTAPYGYLWSNGQATATVVGLGAGVYYSVTLTDANGCDTTLVGLSVGEPLPLQAQATAISPTVCAGSADGSALVTPLGGTAPYSYEWDDLTTANPNNNLAVGVYAVTVADANGCTTTDSVTITEPEPIYAAYSATDNPCAGDSIGVITVDSLSGGGGPYALSLDGVTYFPNITQGYRFDGLVSGTYTLYIEDINGCNDTTEITIAEPDAVTFSAGPDTLIQLGDSVQLQAVLLQAPLGTSLIWTPSTSLSCDDCLEPFAQPTVSTTYLLTWTDTSGCSGSDDVLVQVSLERRVFIPTAFSPNDDGLNDVFMVYGGTGVRRLVSFTIYDRWGELLYSQSDVPATDPAFGWPGTFKGRAMNPGAFVYYIEVEFVDGQVLVYKGDVALIR